MFLVGTARVALPMPVGLPLAGYASRVGNATGVHDDLFARALVAFDGDAAICLLVVDLLCVDARFVAEVRQRISAVNPIRPQAIMIAATHTHSGPAGVAGFALDGAAEMYLGARNCSLMSQVQAALVEAATQAVASATPARLSIGTARVEDVARNRIRVDGPYDPDIPFVIAVDSDDNVVGAILSLATHSTVLGPTNLAYSGDLIGTICHRLEAHWGAGSVVLGLSGAAGDISTRFTRHGSTYAEVERLAARAADAITAERVALVTTEPLGSAQRSLQIALSPAENPEVLQARLADARQRFDALETGAVAQQRLIEVEIEGLLIALGSNQSRPTYVQTEVQVLRMGSVLLAGYPGEMFVEFGLMTRQTLGMNHVLVAGYANDYIGYVPTLATSSGYEATMAVVAPGSGLLLVEAICQLAAE